MKAFDAKKPPIVRLPPRSNFEIMLARAAQVAVIIVGLVAFIFALQAGKFILAPVAMAVVVGLMLGPVASRLEARGVPTWISAAIVFLLFIAIVLVLAGVLAGPLIFWSGELPRIWQELLIRIGQFREPLEAIKGLQEQVREITGGANVTVAVDEGTPVESMAVMAPALFAQLLLFMASIYFFVATRHDIRLTVLKVIVDRRLRWRIAHIFRDVEALVSKYLLSIAAINLGLGIAVTVALWLAGVPSPALWGALAGLLNFVVYIGPAVMTAILLAIGLATYDTVSGVVMPSIIYLSLNLIEAQFVTPMVIGRAMLLNPFVVLLALTFWIWIWGPVGGFIAIPALLVVFAVARNVLPGADGPKLP